MIKPIAVCTDPQGFKQCENCARYNEPTYPYRDESDKARIVYHDLIKPDLQGDHCRTWVQE